MPAGRIAATVLNRAVTVSDGPPGKSNPATGAASSRPPVATVNERLLSPELTSVKTHDVSLNGPPTWPVDVKSSCGVTPKSSGNSKLSRTPVVVLLTGAKA